jgi:hypothetical protein
MLTLHLGVLDQPYAFAGSLKGFRSTKWLKQRNGGKHSALSTYDVAMILEKRYGLMAAFYRVHQSDVANDIEKSLEGAMQTLMMGHAIDPWGSATQSIMARFRDFINSREAERVGIPGTPTGWATWAVNHRLKHPYAHNPRRPSFRDTGLFVASFRAWID